jgi:hypothetical protein
MHCFVKSVVSYLQAIFSYMFAIVKKGAYILLPNLADPCVIWYIRSNVCLIFKESFIRDTIQHFFKSFLKIIFLFELFFKLCFKGTN